MVFRAEFIFLQLNLNSTIALVLLFLVGFGSSVHGLKEEKKTCLGGLSFLRILR